MHRLTIALLAATDAAIAVAVGLAATLAPLTLLWVIGFASAPDWSALWPTGVSLWQLGHAVPLAITLPAEYMAVAGIDPAAAEWTLSLAPLGFAAFTAIFAARSGMRSSRAAAWMTGVLTSSLLFAALTTAMALSVASPVVSAAPWQAVLFPTLLFAVPAAGGAVTMEWIESDAGAIARLRDRWDATGWTRAVSAAVRASAIAVVTLVGLGAAGVLAALVIGGGEIIALYQSAHVDAFGAVLMTLAELVYLPTVLIWAVAWIAGPGFAIGVDTAVSPVGTTLGVLPGIPLLGAVPSSPSPWWLLAALLPVGAGVCAGFLARARLSGEEPIGRRVTVAIAIALAAAAVFAALTTMAAGSLGPGNLEGVGAAPAPVALAIALEVGIGAAIVILAPYRSDEHPGAVDVAPVSVAAAEAPTSVTSEPFEAVTEPIPLPSPSGAARFLPRR